jgi:hypothetical protein
MDDQTLVEALKAAGHADAANAVRDKALAGQLREAGHGTLADQLEGAPVQQADAEPSEGEALAAELKAAATRNTTPIPNFFN